MKGNGVRILYLLLFMMVFFVALVGEYFNYGSLGEGLRNGFAGVGIGTIFVRILLG